MSNSIAFPHRHNSDGSYGSICTACLRTVARAVVESQLHFHETRHICYRAGIGWPSSRALVGAARWYFRSRRVVKSGSAEVRAI